MSILNKIFASESDYAGATKDAFTKLFSKDAADTNEQPYFSISCKNIDPVQGIQIEYESSDEFVLYLRKNGYTGIDDEVILRNFFLKMYAEMHDKLKNNGAPNYGDFE